MLLYVYRLRYRGMRQTRVDMAREGTYGDLRLEPSRDGDQAGQIAYLVQPGTQEEMLHRLDVRSLRIRETLLITGIEQAGRGRKKVEQFRQAWVCSLARIPPERWPEEGRPATPVLGGFGPEHDD